jgi:hypothetical protein
MEKETGRRLLELARKALARVSVHEGGTDLVFELRDVIRKAELEEGRDGLHEVCRSADGIH